MICWYALETQYPVQLRTALIPSYCFLVWMILSKLYRVSSRKYWSDIAFHSSHCAVTLKKKTVPLVVFSLSWSCWKTQNSLGCEDVTDRSVQFLFCVPLECAAEAGQIRTLFRATWVRIIAFPRSTFHVCRRLFICLFIYTYKYIFMYLFICCCVSICSLCFCLFSCPWCRSMSRISRAKCGATSENLKRNKIEF